MNSMIARLLTYFCAVVALVSTTSASAAVVSGTYTGDGSASRTITVGFQPDLVMVQRFDSAIQPMQIRTKDMTFSQSMASTASAPSSAVDITGLTSTGFTLGSGNSNTSGIKYYYFAISETPGEIKIGTYTGTGVDNRNITGIGFQPSFVMAISQSRSTVFKTATMAGELSLTWDTTNATDIIQSLIVDGFQVGTNAMVNANGSSYFFIACKEVASKFKTGTYTGNGTGQSITTVGFQPEGVFIKRDGTTGPGMKWAASGLNTDESITANFTAGPITGAITAILSNGFTLGATGSRVNGNTFAYHYFAFAPQAATAPAPVVTNVTSSTPNGAYNVPDPISIQVTFDSSVTVTGTPTLALNSGGSATYASGSPGTTLTFNYTVGAGQTAADLDYSATNSLALAGGTINATTGGTPATLTLPAPAAAGSLGANKAIIIDTTAPTIGIGSPSVSNIVAGAGSVTYTVSYADTNFSGSTLANGNISLNSTGGASATVGVSGSGLTRTVTLSSITGAGTLGISIASGTASDSAGNTAPAAGPSTTFTVLAPPSVTTAPATNVTSTSATMDGSANANGSITTLTFEWGLTTSYGNSVAMGTTIGAPATMPHNLSGLTPGTEYHFRLVGASAGGTTNGADQSFTTLSTNASLSALSLSAVSLSPPFASGTLTYAVSVPNATSTTTVTATRANANASLQVRINSGGFSALTSGVASSALNLNVGPNAIEVKVTAQDGTTIQTYTINVTRAAAAPAVTSISPTSGSTAGNTAVTITGTGFTGATGATVGGVPLTGVTVNATTITGTTGAHAAGAVDVAITGSPGGASTGGTGAFTYVAPPTVTTVTSSKADGSYNVGVLIPIQVSFSANVDVTGNPPTLALNSGGTASYFSGMGTSTLTFNYMVGPGQNSTDLDYTGPSALDLNGGTIVSSVGGVNATLFLPLPGTANSLGANKAIVIDTTAPTVLSVVRQNPTGQNTTANSVTFRVTYSEPVTLVAPETGHFSIQQVTGNVTGTISGVTGSGSTRDVTVSITGGAGEFRLRVDN